MSDRDIGIFARGLKFVQILESRHSVLLISAGIVLIAAGLIAAARSMSNFGNWPESTDIDVYLNAGRAISAGLSPYEFIDGDFRDPFSYPPFFAGVVALLTTVLGYGELWVLWSYFQAACLAAAVVLMLRGFGHQTPYSWVLIVIGALFLSRVARMDIVHGQINFALLLLLVAGLRQFLVGSTILGAVAWGVMIVCKPFMGIVVFYLLWRREWKLAALVLAISGTLFFASFLPVLPNVVETFTAWLQATHWHTSLPNVAKLDNQSLYGMLMRMLAESKYSTPWAVIPSVVPILMIGFVAAAVAAATRAIPSSPFSKSDPLSIVGPKALLEVGIVVGFALGCGPLFEGDYLYLAVPGIVGATFITLMRLEDRADSASLWLPATALWGLAMINLIIPFGFKILLLHTWDTMSGAEILWSGRLGYILYLAAMVSAFILWREQRLATGVAAAPQVRVAGTGQG